MVDQDNCMGCGGCAVVCPRKAIEFKRDEDGFYKPYVKKTLCVECGLCEEICPRNDLDSSSAQEAFSYKSASSTVLSRSASGGFGFDLSCEMIKDFPVCSTLYDNRTASPRHTVSFLEDELEEKQNSFYLQSYSVDGMKEIIRNGKGVFIGTPCQIAALDRILRIRKIRERYLLIDFFCHGVPSYLVWKKYLDKISNKKDDIKNVKFRSKKYQWGRFTIEFQNGENTQYSDSNVDKDIFYRIYLEAMATSEPCYTCKYHGENSRADIRMGDFWGEKYKKDTEGVSALLVYTDIGKDALLRTRQRGYVESVGKDDILQGQIKEDIPMPSCRNDLLKQLRTGKTLKEINNTVVFHYKLKRKINRMMGREFV